VAFPSSTPLDEAVAYLAANHSAQGQRLYPVLDADESLAGVLTRKRLQELAAGEVGPLGGFVRTDPVVAYADEPLRLVVYRMASTGCTRMPVLADTQSRRLVGIISLQELLRARARSLAEERDRERVIRIRLPFGVLEPRA
jgi:CBS domain-containing protein